MGWHKHDREQDNYLRSSCYVLADPYSEALHSNQEAGEPDLAENLEKALRMSPIGDAKPFEITFGTPIHSQLYYQVTN